MHIFLFFLLINFSSGKGNHVPQSLVVFNDSIPMKFTDSTERRQRDLKKEANWENRVYTKVQNYATFPGGDAEWNNYIKQEIMKHLTELIADGNSGTCRVRFIVNSDGSVNNLSALTMKGTKLEQVAVNAIKKGPKWNPATQDGRAVNAYREQPITFIIGNK